MNGERNPSQPKTVDDDRERPVTDAAAAWAVLAESFPAWTLEPPLMLEPRRPTS